MPVNVVKSKKDEELWGRAKDLASEQGHSKDWAYIMSIYQGLKGNKKSASENKQLLKSLLTHRIN